jgi:hypothetical protein
MQIRPATGQGEQMMTQVKIQGINLGKASQSVRGPVNLSGNDASFGHQQPETK